MNTNFRRPSWLPILLAIATCIFAPLALHPTTLGQTASLEGEPFKLTSIFQSYEGSNKGLLTVTVALEDEWHVYSLTQPDGGPTRSKIVITPSDKFSLAGEFEPDSDPVVKIEEGFAPVKSEFHERVVNWRAPIEFADDVRLEELSIKVSFSGQRCAELGCVPIRDARAVANFAGAIQVINSEAPFRSAGSNVLISGTATRLASENEASQPQQPTSGRFMPGDKGEVAITLEPVDDYHFYQYSPSPDPAEEKSYTLIGLTKTNGWQFDAVQTSPKTVDKVEMSDGVKAFKCAVTFKVPFEIPKDANKKDYRIGGVLGLDLWNCNDRGRSPDRLRRFNSMVRTGVQTL